jgi:hypothetical protein
MAMAREGPVGLELALAPPNALGVLGGVLSYIPLLRAA